MRLIFFTDLVRGDALNYAHAAYELSQGRLHLGGWSGTSRLALYAPVALLYKLFGPNEVTTLIYPIACSLLTIVFIYLITRLYGGISAGLVAATLWTFLSLDVHLASILLPDGPLAAFSTGSVYFLFLWDRNTKKKRWILLAISSAMLVWAILIKPLAITTGFFVLIFVGARIWTRLNLQDQRPVKKIVQLSRGKIVVPIAIILLFAGLFAFASIQPRPFLVSLARTATDLGGFLFLGATELDFSSIRFSQSILLVFWAPLFLVAVFFSLARRRRELKWLLVWLAVLFLYYEWGSIETNLFTYIPLEGFNEARNFLFVLPPLIIVAALYLSEALDTRIAVWLLPGIALSVAGLAWVLKPNLYSGQVPAWVEISPALILAGTAISPLFVLRKENKMLPVFAGVFVILISIASLKPVLPYHALMYMDRQQILANARDSYTFWNENPAHTIFVRDQGLAMTLNYAGDFQLGYDWSGIGLDDKEAKIRIEDPEPGRQGFIVLTGVLENVPADWVFQTSFGSDPQTSLSIFRLGSSQ